MKHTDRIELRVLGLSYAKLKNAAYMLILSQVGGSLNINMWIGESEAHAIALAMERVHVPRPMIHDLFASFVHAFGVRLVEVFIYRVEDDVFYAELKFTDGERTVTLDARTSDAIALAMRVGAPIYTTRAVLEEKGFLIDIQRTDDVPEDDAVADNDPESSESAVDDDVRDNYVPRLDQYSIKQLEDELQKCIETERYEDAAKITEILKQKRGEA